jgi:hypothetical protein
MDMNASDTVSSREFSDYVCLAFSSPHTTDSLDASQLQDRFLQFSTRLQHSDLATYPSILLEQKSLQPKPAAALTAFWFLYRCEMRWVVDDLGPVSCQDLAEAIRLVVGPHFPNEAWRARCLLRDSHALSDIPSGMDSRGQAAALAWLNSLAAREAVYEIYSQCNSQPESESVALSLAALGDRRATDVLEQRLLASPQTFVDEDGHDYFTVLEPAPEVAVSLVHVHSAIGARWLLDRKDRWVFESTSRYGGPVDLLRAVNRTYPEISVRPGAPWLAQLLERCEELLAGSTA